MALASKRLKFTSIWASISTSLLLALLLASDAPIHHNRIEDYLSHSWFLCEQTSDTYRHVGIRLREQLILLSEDFPKLCKDRNIWFLRAHQSANLIPHSEDLLQCGD